MRAVTGRSLLVLATSVVLAVGCSNAPTPTATSGSQAPSPSTTAVSSTGPSSTPMPVAHRIGVRLVDGRGEFYDRTTGQRFVPRGMNYIRLGGPDNIHVTLNKGIYDPQRLEAAFAEMARRGYNTVRIFLCNKAGGLPGPGTTLNPVFLDNAVDALRRAREHGIYVMFTHDFLPDSPSWAFTSDPGIEDINAFYLSRGGVETVARFYRELTEGLVERGAPLDALLGYELSNELFFTNTAAPFSLASGTVTTANGQTYDVSTAEAKRKLMEDGLVFYVDRMRQTILAVDPTALVTVGFFDPNWPNVSRPGSDWIIWTRQVLLRSTADFIDFHAYPDGLTLAQTVENYELPAKTAKPVIMGEFGVWRQKAPTRADAVRTLVNWQTNSCRFGFGGWLFWTWDSASEQPEWWNALDADGAIADALSPALRPDPCVMGSPGADVSQGDHPTP